MSLQVLRPETPDDAAEAVRSTTRVRPRGAGTKAPLSASDTRCVTIDMTAVKGVLEYDPGEYTFTAFAGTPVAEIAAQLAQYRQGLPFDPLLARAGATLGGTVASDANGPGRLRFGGVRDFLIGVRFIDGAGRWVRGGGKVVKNAAGFDFPKLLVGSMGRLGVLVELTFKVFPEPEARTTAFFSHSSPVAAVTSLRRVLMSSLDVEAADIESDGQLVIRQAGTRAAAEDRVARLQKHMGRAADRWLKGDDDRVYWEAIREFDWCPEEALVVKIPTTPRRVATVEEIAARGAAVHRYSVGGNVAWVAWPVHSSLDELEESLRSHNLTGLIVRGAGSRVFLSAQANAFGERVRRALDPDGRLGGICPEAARIE